MLQLEDFLFVIYHFEASFVDFDFWLTLTSLTEFSEFKSVVMVWH